MSTDNQETNYLKWLQDLGRESWQMELLVSGFSIAVIFGISDVIDSGIEYLSFHTNENGLVRYALVVIKLATNLTGINLFAHVILRAFWIGTIGLRSVSPTIDFTQLGYGKFFTQKLQQRVKSLDESIKWLDGICSSIFAFTFLIVMCFVAFILAISFLIFVTYSINYIQSFFTKGSTSYEIISSLSLIIGLTTIIGCVIYLIDFLTLGLIKKNSWIGKVYYPFYKVFGFITLAPLYRGIYYHFIYRFKKRAIASVFFIYILLAFLIHAYTFEYYIFITDNTTHYEMIHNRYENQLNEAAPITIASVQNDIISDPFIKLFIRYDIRDNQALTQYCDFKPQLQEGFNPTTESSFYINQKKVIGRNKNDDDPSDALNCLGSFYQVYLDGNKIDSLDFLFYTHPHKSEKGILTYISTDSLTKGKHVIQIIKPLQKETTEDTLWESKHYADIPFWFGK